MKKNWEYFLGTKNPQSHYVAFNEEMTLDECFDALEESGVSIAAVEFIQYDDGLANHLGFKNVAIFHEKKIKPHKGGRITDLHVRLSPDEKQRIKDKSAALGISQADLIVVAVHKYKGAGVTP